MEKKTLAAIMFDFVRIVDSLRRDTSIKTFLIDCDASLWIKRSDELYWRYKLIFSSIDCIEPIENQHF